MDVQQLIADPTTSGSWSLRGQDPEGVGPRPDQAPWWERDALEDVRAAEPALPAPSRTVARAMLLVGIVAALAVSAVAAGALLTGHRWFVVETPSMGTAAPVGSLVVTGRAPAHLRAGSIIAFVPPGAPRVYTHRVVAVAADGGITTRGDINGAADGWTIRPSAVLGQAIAVVPGGGYLLRGLPALLVGSVLLWLVTLPLRRADHRAAARIIGLHLLGTLIVLWQHPFVQVVPLAMESVGERVHQSVVATGLLPVRLVDAAGAVFARLEPGRPAVVTMPSATDGTARLFAMPDLAPVQQLLLIALAVLPALVVLVVGLPRRPSSEVAA